MNNKNIFQLLLLFCDLLVGDVESLLDFESLYINFSSFSKASGSILDILLEALRNMLLSLLSTSSGFN